MKTTVIKFDQRDPDLSKIREVARASREGKIVAFPTETVYGIGAPMNANKVEQSLREIKKRDEGKPFSYHIGALEMVYFLNVKITPEFRYLTRLFWPGPLTLVVLDKEGHKIGLRFPRHRLTAALINATGVPFIGTSANMSGEVSPRSAEAVMQQLDGQIEYLIDGGPTELGQDSTVVDLTDRLPKVLREGADLEAIKNALDKISAGRFPRKKILIVCTGNSCRSPMAAGWLLNELKRKGLQEQIEVGSCGIGARTGSPATPEAVLIMKNREIDISAHRSKPCSREDIMDADLIFAMSQEHYMFISSLAPQVKDRVRVLNIADPIGMGIMVYEDVVAQIEKKMKDKWNEIIV